jgi:hypothetical protein
VTASASSRGARCCARLEGRPQMRSCQRPSFETRAKEARSAKAPIAKNMTSPTRMCSATTQAGAVQALGLAPEQSFFLAHLIDRGLFMDPPLPRTSFPTQRRSGRSTPVTGPFRAGRARSALRRRAPAMRRFAVNCEENPSWNPKLAMRVDSVRVRVGFRARPKSPKFGA